MNAVNLKNKEKIPVNLPNEDFVVECRKMREIYDKAARIAPYGVTVLVTGESGTGKDKLAQYIHRSSFVDGDFVHINCSAIPEQLFESKMFGYEAGAFTGALKNGYIGFIEQATGGTLFLDEIGDMPIELQSKMLTFLEHRVFTKVGSTKPLFADVRIIAATNKNMKEMIRNNLFREDLYYRLSTVEIELPPLKKRKKEVPHFLEYFLRVFNNKYNRKVKYDKESMRILTECEWHGNIRELRHTVEKLVILCPSDIIKPDFINSECSSIFRSLSSEESNLKNKLELYEKELIISSLKNNVTLMDAAKSLGIDLSTLTRKRQKFKI